MDAPRMHFLSDDAKMWQWLLSTDSGRSLLRSRETFSSLDLCRQDAMRALKGLVLTASCQRNATSSLNGEAAPAASLQE